MMNSRNFRGISDDSRGRFRDRPRGGFGGRSRGGFGGGFRDRDSGRGRRPVEMHDVVCDKCGKNCQVPFRPTEGKPVYCSECFEKNDGGRGSGREKSSSPGISFDQFKQINKKLDMIIEALNIEKDEDDSDDDSDEDSEEAEGE